MAKEQSPPAYADADEYDVQVTRPVRVGAFQYLPRHAIQATGRLINRIIKEHGDNAIRTAVKR